MNSFLWDMATSSTWTSTGGLPCKILTSYCDDILLARHTNLLPSNCLEMGLACTRVASF